MMESPMLKDITNVISDEPDSANRRQNIAPENVEAADVSIPTEPAVSSTIRTEYDPTIGEGIAIVEPQRIEEVKQSVITKPRFSEVMQKRREQKLLEQENYEKELHEKNYKSLMHILNHSKTLSSFILNKVDNSKLKKKGPNFYKRAINTARDGSPPKKKLKEATNKEKISEEITRKFSDASLDEQIETEISKPAVEFVQPRYFKGELRDYQKIGLNWLIWLYENGLSGILADEMGLGKTIQVIALFAYLIEKKIPGPYMIIVPLSTLPNWTSEFERFAPELPVVIFYGNAEQRIALRPKVEKKIKMAPGYSTHPIVIMAYGAPLSDASFLRKFNWRYIVIDEAQRIKNFECQLFRIVKSFKSMNRLLLTGTPLQNNLTELWSLLNFLLPDVFYDLNVFQAWFDAKTMMDEEGKRKFLEREAEKNVLKTLSEILHTFMIRRLKEEVCPDIPAMKEVMVYTPLTAIQFELYSAILKRDLAVLARKESSPLIVDIDGKRPKRRCTLKFNYDYEMLNNVGITNAIKYEDMKVGNSNVHLKKVAHWTDFTTLTEENVHYYVRLNMANVCMLYRHVVNHPYLIHYPLDDCGLTKVDENIIKSAGKMLVLRAMLKKLKERGHKILLFSNFKMTLDIIEDWLCNMTDYKYLRLDGDIVYDQRRETIEQFQNDEGIFLFLMTTKTGGVGLNLAAADTVIIYDSDWNPQNDIQAMARCHRIGQTKPVAVYRLCTKSTVDEEIIKRAQAKRFLEKTVMGNEKTTLCSIEGLKKLKKLLEDCPFKVLDPRQDVYTDAELDELLDRSDLIPSTKIS